jgi:glycosyltransferase involved in cell wall biosynthesis
VTTETGILCSPRDASAYADALYRLIEIPELRKALGSSARDRAERYFKLSNYRRVAEIYDAILRVERSAVVSRAA